MTRYERVVAILDQAIGGPGASIGAHGPFWRGLSRDAFVAQEVFSLPLVVVGDGAGSNLVKALKGETPFGSGPGATFPRMPFGFPPVPEAEIAFIQRWIDDGCLEDEFVPGPGTPAPGPGG